MGKKVIATLLAALGLLAVSMSARADVYFNVDAPEDWAERELLRVVAVDTNRTDAMFLTCGGEAMMVDGGSGKYEHLFYDLMETYGMTSFKYLFSSHSDQDHIEGLRYIMLEEKYPVGEFVSACNMNYRDELGYHQQAVNIIRSRNVPYHIVESGDELTLGGATMTVMRCTEIWGRNARSATLMISYGESRIFLTGDIDSKTMRHYVEKYGEEALRADIVKSPHHGIASMPKEFLEAVDAKLCFVTNQSKRVPEFAKSVTRYLPEAKVLFCGDASILMETDGTDWYIWQELDK